MSGPEFDGQPMSKREVMIARHAADEAVKWMFTEMRRVREVAVEHVDGRAYAENAWPLPTVPRPREVKDPHEEMFWRFSNHFFNFRWRVWPEGEWSSNALSVPTPERIALWADLLANPDEEVEE